METFRTEQESFWAGQFGDEYVARNQGGAWVASNTALFSKILENGTPVQSIIEFGANIGLNLLALRRLLPDVELSAVEINQNAVEKLRQIQDLKVYHSSLLEFHPDYQRDFVLIKGVLIHMNPERLPQVYDLLYETSKRYVCIAEYYNPSPIEIPYRGHAGKLFKRDFAGEFMERFGSVRLLKYGFVYHRDPQFPQDDITWFLLEKLR